jgi:hypothetical protein
MEITCQRLRFLVTALSLFISGCATAANREGSQDCKTATATYKELALNVNDFRDKSKSNDSLMAILKRNHYDVNDEQLIDLRRYAHKECGGKNDGLVGSMQDWAVTGDANQYTVGVYKSLATMKEQRLKNLRHRTSESLAAKISKINIGNVYEDETRYRYPSFAGLMKQEAQDKRKAFLQEKVLWELMSCAAGFAIFHKGLQDSLNSKLMIPLSGSQAQAAAEKLKGTFDSYDISKTEVADAVSALKKYFWQSGLRAEAITGEQKAFYQTGSSGSAEALRDEHQVEEDAMGEFFTDIAAFYPYSYANGREVADDDLSYTSSKEEKIAQLVKSRALRSKMLASLILSEAKITVQRVSETDFIIKTQVGFPDLFRKYPLKEISPLIEH